MKRLTEFQREPQPSMAPTKPAWQCAAWGCTLPGGINSTGQPHCRFHHGADTAVFDEISDLVNREAWRLRLIRCAQAAPSNWRDMCRSLANKYDRAELDPYVLDMNDADSAKYEHLVYANMNDVLKEPVAKAMRNVPVTINNGDDRALTPLEIIQKWRDQKRKRV